MDELRAKIATLRHDNFGCGSHQCPHWQKDCNNYDWTTSWGLCPEMLEQILALIKEAGYIKPSPASVEEIAKELNNILGMCFERSPRWRAVVLALEKLLGEIYARQLLPLISHKELTVPKGK